MALEHLISGRNAARTNFAAPLTILLLFAPATAQAQDAFATFELRCLVPMIEILESDVSGLTRIPHRAAWESWVPESGDWELRRNLPGAEPVYCAIHGEYDPDYEAIWADGAVASGNFEITESEPLTLLSTFIREPKIEVVLDWSVPSLTVIETDLES